jgi:DNA-binding NarL/FixJ family response regulator
VPGSKPPGRRKQTAGSGRFSGLLSPGEWKEIVARLGLSPAQARIVRLILQGHQDKQIAARLDLKMPTVRTYMSRIFTRLDVADRVEVVLLVFKTFRELQR